MLDEKKFEYYKLRYLETVSLWEEGYKLFQAQQEEDAYALYARAKESEEELVYEIGFSVLLEISKELDK